jgi:signal peptidase I
VGFKVETREQPKDRPVALLLVPLTAVFLAVVVVFQVIYTYSQVDGDSMEPTFHSGDRVLMAKSYPQPRRGDVVSISTRMKGRFGLLKRVIALGGDTVRIVDGHAFVNEKPEGDWPVIGQPFWGESQVMKVPADSVFVLGDNRPVSEDSRVWGTVPLGDINGQVVFVVYPLSRFGRFETPGAGG